MFKKLVLAFSLLTMLLGGGNVVLANNGSMQLDTQKFHEGTKKTGGFFSSLGNAFKSFFKVIVKLVNALADAVVKFLEGFFRFVKDPVGTAKKSPNKTLRPAEQLKDKGLIN